MATAGQIREWLENLPDEAEVVVWHEEMRERPIISVIHVADEEIPSTMWNKGIVVAGQASARKKRHLRVVE